jgi:hypothetical protein
MADSIPRAYLKELTDTLAAETLNVALFVNLTGYDATTATTYAALAATASEVSATGTGYTTGGILLSGKASANYGSNGAMMTATATAVTAATFIARYAVIYNATTGKIRFIKDLLSNVSVTSGTFTVTWNTVSGVVNITFTA